MEVQVDDRRRVTLRLDRALYKRVKIACINEGEFPLNAVMTRLLERAFPEQPVVPATQPKRKKPRELRPRQAEAGAERSRFGNARPCGVKAEERKHPASRLLERRSPRRALYKRVKIACINEGEFPLNAVMTRLLERAFPEQPVVPATQPKRKKPRELRPRQAEAGASSGLDLEMHALWREGRRKEASREPPP